MKSIESGSIDMVLADPPYGTTKCKWDSIIPLDKLWDELLRVTKHNAAIVMTCTQPFTSLLVMSNLKMFKYCWVWNKITARGHLVAKKRPMAQHEDICVFYRSAPTYNPQMTKKDRPQLGWSVEASRTEIMGGSTTKDKYRVVRTHSYPKTIITFGMDGDNFHPTQKPVALGEYLIRTYTNPRDTVLDFCMGSGSFGVSAISAGRNFVGIELDEEYFEIAKTRIDRALSQPRLFF